MRKPEGVDCNHCENWYWYADLCEAYSDDEVENRMSPRNIDCDRFTIKTRSERGYEHYNPLPPPEIIELVSQFKENHDDT